MPTSRRTKGFAVCVLALLAAAFAALRWAGSTSRSPEGLPVAPAASAEAPASPRPSAPDARRSPEAAEPAPLDDAPERSTLVTVLELDGAPIEGALVRAAAGEELVELGATDSRGALRAQWTALAADELVASAPGHAPRTVAVDQAPPSSIEIRLARAGELAGRVVLEDGRPVGAGVRVFAWSEAESGSTESALRAMRDDPRALGTLTDELGRFVLRGLVPDHLYTAVAAGDGYASPELVQRVTTAMPELRLVVHRAYAAWVRLREVGGAPLRTCTSMYDRRFGTPRGPGLPFERIAGASVALLFGNDVERDASLRDRLYVFTSAADEPALGPYQLTIDYPGYDEGTVSFVVPAVDDAGPAEVVLELRPSTQAWCTLELRFDGPLAGSVDARPLSPPAVLRLVDADGGSCGYALRESFPERVEIEGLPAGTYTWDLERNDGSSYFGEGSGERALRLDSPRTSLAIDLSEFGGLELRVLRADGSRYRGRAVVVALTEEDRARPSTSFASPPYALAALPPGLYEVWVDEPRFLDRSRESARRFGVTVGIDAGRMSRAEIRLPE